LVTSSLPVGFADTLLHDSQNIESLEQPITQTKKSISINLEENMGLSTEPSRKNEMINVPKYTDTIS
jgi:hypothetical protein